MYGKGNHLSGIPSTSLESRKTELRCLILKGFKQKLEQLKKADQEEEGVYDKGQEIHKSGSVESFSKPTLSVQDRNTDCCS